jgi:ubiquitin-protein ligase
MDVALYVIYAVTSVAVLCHAFIEVASVMVEPFLKLFLLECLDLEQTNITSTEINKGIVKSSLYSPRLAIGPALDSSSNSLIRPRGPSVTNNFLVAPSMHTMNGQRHTSYQAEREQALRDYKVTIEYKHLKSHAPGGVYLIPSYESLRLFHGVIFVRRGPYTNGIFKFTLELPTLYNDINQHPIITFTSKVYNPYVDMATGRLDLQSAYPRWDPSRHYLVTVLTFLKKIFYAKTFEDAMANVEAKTLAATNPVVFRTKVDVCVGESQQAVFDSNDSATTTLKFTDEKLSHRVMHDLLKKTVKDPSQVSREMILSMIDTASREHGNITSKANRLAP